MTLYIGIGSATFICVSRGVVLIYFTVEERIERFETEIEVSDWLKLSEKWCARARAQLAAAGGIIPLNNKGSTARDDLFSLAQLE
jgi:hypothetical protein